MSTRARRGSAGFTAGFTMMELMVTVAIIGILVGAASLSVYRRIPVWRLDQAQNQIFSDFRKARMEAVARVSEVTIQLNDGAGTYTITGGGLSQTKSIANIEGVTMASNPSALTFRPNGTMSSASVIHTVTLSSEGLTSREIRTVPNGQVDLVR